MDQLKELLNKVPYGVVVAAFFAYLGFDYYTFTTDPSSPLLVAKANYKSLQEETKQLNERIKKAEEFNSSLNSKRVELRNLANQLSDMKAVLTDSIDAPGFIKFVITEANKVGLKVVSIRPVAGSEMEFYAEQPFDLKFRGAFVQLAVFLERLANMERIVRVEELDVRREGSSTATFVELGGTVQIKAFRYLASKADDAGKALGALAPASAAPASGGGASGGGTAGGGGAAPAPQGGGK